MVETTPVLVMRQPNLQRPGEKWAIRRVLFEDDLPFLGIMATSMDHTLLREVGYVLPERTWQVHLMFTGLEPDV